MIYLSKRSKVILFILAAAVVFATGTFYIKSRNSATEITKTQTGTAINVEDTAVKAPAAEAEIEKPKEIKEIVVYVCGKGIKNPQNVSLKEGARVEDAIIAAGGALKDADLDQINLAQILADQDKVYIPQKGEVMQPSAQTGNISVEAGNPGSKQVNINTASAEQLDRLPGVGPSTAQKIVSYRSSNGGFKSIDELKNVSGIGDKKFDGLKEYVSVK